MKRTISFRKRAFANVRGSVFGFDQTQIKPRKADIKHRACDAQDSSACRVSTQHIGSKTANRQNSKTEPQAGHCPASGPPQRPGAHAVHSFFFERTNNRVGPLTANRLFPFLFHAAVPFLLCVYRSFYGGVVSAAPFFLHQASLLQP